MTIVERPRRQLAAVMFTDIVGYTALMQSDEQLGIATRAKYLQTLQAQHAAFGGTIVQTYGDGSLSTFPNSVDAIRCALAIQQECRRPPVVPLRAGIHMGEVIVDPSNVIGDAVNIASRIESFCVPGGVLLSDSVHDQVRNQTEFTFIGLGTFKLKNVGRPFEIFALMADALAVPAADILAGKGERFASLPSNLPEPATQLLGREEDAAAVVDLLEHHRVVTVTGPGGMGKTRLAIEVGQRLASHFLDGIAFVSLAHVADAADFMPAVAETLDVREAEGRTLADGVAALIADREALLLLDNLEQLVAAAPEVAELVSTCPQLRILATSRTPLRISAEQQYALVPLALPPLEAAHEAESTLAYPSIALFVERAKMANRGFELTAENSSAVVAICRRLDGLPLAIELAAARIGLLSPAALLQRLDHALDLLTTGARDRPSRQQTLRATIDWSHSLLSDSEKRLFRRMAVFHGGSALASIEDVCGESAENVLEDLTSLVDKGLVQVAGGGDRFGMLQTIREYALEELQAATEAEPIEWRHAAHFAELAAEIGRGIEGAGQVAAIELGVVEDANVRAALDFLLSRARLGDVESAELGMRMCGDLWMFWHIRSKHLSAREYALGFLDTTAGARPPTIERSKALRAGALASWTLGHYEKSVEQYREAFDVAQQHGDEREMALAALGLGLGYLGIDMARAVEWATTAIERSQSLEYRWALGLALTVDGILSAVSGDATTAGSRYRDALAIQQSIGDKEGAGLSLGGLAQLASASADLPTAIDLYRQSLDAFEAIGDRAEGARILAEIAWAHLSAGDEVAARRSFLDSVQAYSDIGSVRGIGTSMIGLAAVEEAEGRPLQAVQIAAAAEVFAREEGIVNVYSENVPGHDYVERAKAALGADEVERALARGRGLSVREALGLARETQ
jgi:predicted ATPase/class 3 adenylate cyclase